jgi:Flp pilus assembly protein TadB
MGRVREWVRADLDGEHTKRPDEPWVWRRHWWILVFALLLIVIVLVAVTSNIVEAALGLLAVIAAMLGVGYLQLRGSRKRAESGAARSIRRRPKPMG